LEIFVAIGRYPQKGDFALCSCQIAGGGGYIIIKTIVKTLDAAFFRYTT